MNDLTIAAYYYPGWHSCPVRDAGFKKGFSEWDLVFDADKRFEGHEQPNLPLWGREDESIPEVFEKKIEAAESYGVDAFVFAFYWSRGKRLLEGAIDRGYLGASNRDKLRFAVMWANRMPRKVLPVKDPNARLIDPGRLVHTDPDDFLAFIKHVAEKYFVEPNYLRVCGGLYLSIFDTNFFLRQMGLDTAKSAIERARRWLRDNGFGELHLAAIDPAPQFRGELKRVGFDSVTHYVLLPEWKGKSTQDFEACVSNRISEWPEYRDETALPYFPSVTPGWDATPRSVDYGKEKPKHYPWSPVVTGRSPQKLGAFLERAACFTRQNNPSDPLCFVSSWNEWSEGHYLEPDETHGFEWLEAVRAARGRSPK